MAAQYGLHVRPRPILFINYNNSIVAQVRLVQDALLPVVLSSYVGCHGKMILLICQWMSCMPAVSSEV